MLTKVFFSYRLKPDASLEDFLEWSRTVDQPFTNAQPAVHRFEVFVVSGTDGNAPSHQIFESIWVESWEAWQATTGSEAFAPIVETWKTFVDDSDTQALYGTRVV